MVDSKVKHCDHHARVSCAQPPCVLDAYVSSCQSLLVDAAVVDEVPLVIQVFVIERQLCGFL